MAFCANCGAAVTEGASFCPSCGARVGAGPQTAGPQQPAAPMTPNAAAALSYLPYAGFIIGIIFLVIEPYRRDPFVRFHAFQSIFLSAAAAIAWIIWSDVFSLPFFASFGIVWNTLGLMWGLLRVACLLIWLFMMYKAYRNERYLLPWIGPLAAKQAGE
jgi:uncharacterized membrane protein